MPSRRTALILNDPVSKHSRTDYTALRPNWCVRDALEHMRAHPPAGRVIYIYVTDEDGRLLGVVPTRRLLLSGPETAVAELMIKNVIALPSMATVLDACEFFTMHRLLAFPIVDEQRRLIGLIDVDLYTEELTTELGEEGEESEQARKTDDIFELMRRFNGEYRTTFLVVTHDPRIAARCQRVIEIVDGRITKDVSKSPG